MADPVEVFGQEKWEWMLRHIDDTRVPLIITICTLGMFLSLVFLAMRLWSRRLAHGKLKLDLSDWLCVGSVVFTLMTAIDILVGTRFGAGRHIPALTDLRSLYLIFIIANAAHPAAMGGLKLSILALFYSIFPSRTFRWCCWGVGVFIVLWTAVSIITGIALCIPIQKLWDPTITGGVCLPLAPMGLAITSAHIFTDLVVLFMPVPVVLKLKTTRRRKTLVISSFMVGVVVCVISIVRLPVWVTSGSTGDFGWDNIPGAMLAVAELTIGILAASAPIYRPFLRWASGKGKQGSSGSGPERNTPLAAGPDSFTRNSRKNNLRSEATRGPPMMSPREYDRSITITDEFELSTHHNVLGSWHQIPDPPCQDTDHLFPQGQGKGY